MHIFLDESGTFVPPKGNRHSVCCVAALAIPDSCLESAVGLHRRLLAYWKPLSGEIKGSALAERQFSRLITSLGNLDVVLNIFAIDMRFHPDAVISRHKQAQAENLRRSVVGPEFVQSFKDGVHELATRFDRLPNQLYVESVLLSEAVARTLQTTTLHYSQTEPPTLGTLAWRIDAKDKDLTEYERLWLDVVKPVIQSKTMNEPIFTVRDFDYSAMTPFQNEVLAEAPPHLRPGLPPEKRQGPFHSFDSRKLMADLAFRDSLSEPGLQFADALASAFRRACNDRLGERGWRDLGRLLVRASPSGLAVEFLALNPAVRHRGLSVPYWHVLEQIEKLSSYWLVARRT